jgi:hypothetical protein
MKIRVMVASLILLSMSVSAGEYRTGKNEWLHIPVSLPEEKIGGGDFYNLSLDPAFKESSIEYILGTEGVRVRSHSAGEYSFRLMVNHVTKSSCAGVEVQQYLHDEIVLHVTD